MAKKDIKTDVLIVGSGPIGATYARFLVGNGYRVMMVDAGEQLSKRPGWHLQNAYKFQLLPHPFSSVIGAELEPYSIAPQKSAGKGRLNFENPNQDSKLNMPGAAVTYAVGGMFTHWTACAPWPTFMERSPLIPNEEWAALLPIASRLFNVHRDAFEPSFLNSAIKSRLNSNGVLVENLPMGAERRVAEGDGPHLVTWTGTDTVLGPLAGRPKRLKKRFKILPQHLAVELKQKGPKVKYALVKDLRNLTTRKIYADTFIVAAGPFYTPRLLWQSGIRFDALGRYLNENPVAGCRVILGDEILEMLRAEPSNPAAHDAIPIPRYDPEPMLGFDPSPDKPWHTQIHRAGRYNSYDAPEDVRLVVDFIWFGMVDPSPDNRITFSDRYTDRFGQPQITIEYRLSQADQDRAAAMKDDLAQTAALVGDYNAPHGVAPTFVPNGSSLHLQGTYRMGDAQDETTSVVDTHSKVWGVDNLYLGGLGVIPTKMANNPTLTACALAVRSVGHILNKPAVELGRQLAEGK